MKESKSVLIGIPVAGVGVDASIHYFDGGIMIGDLREAKSEAELAPSAAERSSMYKEIFI